MWKSAGLHRQNTGWNIELRKGNGARRPALHGSQALSSYLARQTIRYFLAPLAFHAVRRAVGCHSGRSAGLVACSPCRSCHPFRPVQNGCLCCSACSFCLACFPLNFFVKIWSRRARKALLILCPLQVQCQQPAHRGCPVLSAPGRLYLWGALKPCLMLWLLDEDLSRSTAMSVTLSELGKCKPAVNGMR